MPSLSVAVVGAGPAGLYVAQELLKQSDSNVCVDLYDRLPTPFGLLRYGVAPDHVKMKAAGVPLQRVLEDPRVRFLGNVEVGRDVFVAELRERYSAVVYGYGAAGDRRLDVAGEDLAGSVSAAEFVGWYSAHPDARDLAESLTRTRTAVVVGAGNVAIDVARMLVLPRKELAGTDVPDQVLQALGSVPVRDVHLVIRRGPAQVRFATKELRDLAAVPGIDMVVAPESLVLSPEDAATIAADASLSRTFELLQEWAHPGDKVAGPRIHVHFWRALGEIVGAADVEAVTLMDTRTGRTVAELPTELVVRCVGYRGLPLDDVPFDAERGTVPHDAGRVLRDGVPSPGEYAVGWIARGPVGLLGTNRVDAADVVRRLLADELPLRGPWDAPNVLAGRGAAPVLADGWAAIDRQETELGQSRGAARMKLASWTALLTAARETSKP